MHPPTHTPHPAGNNRDAMMLAVTAAVKVVLRDAGPEGDLLVFLPGVGEIRSVQKMLRVSSRAAPRRRLRQKAVCQDYHYY